jgi:hypothetical protein
MEKNTKFLLTAFVLLVGISISAVLFYGIRPQPISKISISVFEKTDVVVNALFLSMSEELDKSSIFFLGIDTTDPFFNEVYQKFLTKSLQLSHPFDALVVDSSAGGQAVMKEERFAIKAEPERFFAGLKTVQERGLRLLVVVPPTEASTRLPGSLISTVKKSTPVPIMGLVFSAFPRSREQEESLSIPCNTGEEDLGGTALLGCAILQKARGLYRKHFPTGTHIGLLDQTGASEFIFLLTTQP